MSTISAGTTLTTALVQTGDTTGELVIKTDNGNTTAVTFSTAGNIDIPGTGKRITGDFSNATVANRVIFQTSTTDNNTAIYSIPNGTAVVSQFAALNNSDPTNASTIGIRVSSTESRLEAARAGTGTYLPMTFYTNGSERMRVDTSGNVGIGTSSPSAKLDVRTAAGTAAQQNLYTGSSGAAATLQFGQIGAIAWDVGITSTSGHFQIGVNGGGLGYNINRSGTAIDYHSWSTAGSERMRIDSSGNVGIGTNSPNDVLEVAGANAFIRVNRTGNEPGITLRYSNSTTNRGDIAVTSGGAMYFTAGGATERMRITAAGGMSFGSSGTAYGSSGQVLTSNGDAPPSWQTAGGIGVGQTWTDVGGSRSSGTTYTNSTGKPIQIMVCTDNTGNTNYGSGGAAKFYINGSNVGQSFCSNAANVGGLFQAIIPVSSTYQVSASTIRSWWELR